VIEIEKTCFREKLKKAVIKEVKVRKRKEKKRKKYK